MYLIKIKALKLISKINEDVCCVEIKIRLTLSNTSKFQLIWGNNVLYYCQRTNKIILTLVKFFFSKLDAHYNDESVYCMNFQSVSKRIKLTYFLSLTFTDKGNSYMMRFNRKCHLYFKGELKYSQYKNSYGKLQVLFPNQEYN